MSDTKAEALTVSGEALERVTDTVPCPLCGRQTVRSDRGGVMCPDEDSTCWRGGEAALDVLAQKRSEA